MDTKKLRQKILDLAIRGKLVPQDPNDEPASVLLERIREEKKRLVKERKLKKKDLEETPISEDEKPFEIPESWEWCRIKAILSLQAGKNVTSADIHSEQNSVFKYPCYGGNGLRGYVKNYNNEGTYPLIGRQGALCGNVNMAHGQFWATEHAVVTDGWRVTDVKWQYFFLIALNLNKYATATAQPGLAVSNIIEVPIPLPPLAEQKRITNAVERWFTLIDELESNEGDLLKAIDKAKSKILDLAIHGKLVPQDPNDEPAIELLKRINPKFEPCDEVPWELPNNWCWTTIGSIFNHNTGKALNKSDSQEGLLLPYITTSNVYWNRFVLSDIKKMFFKDSEIDKCTVTKGDLLVCEGGDIGRSAIWNFDYDICIQNHIHRLRAKGDISHLLYLYVLMLYKWTDRIQGKGIGLQGLSSGLLDKLIVPLPPYAEQLRIVTKIEELFAVLDGIKESLEV